MTEKPFPDSYWVLPGQFLAGAYPASSDGIEVFTRLRLDALLEAGINSFYDLTLPGERLDYLPLLEQEARRFNAQVAHRRYPTVDRGLMQPIRMRALLQGVEADLAAGRKVYLHCVGGIGRTGTAVGCWLASHGYPAGKALERLKELYQDSAQYNFYPRSPENDAQVKYILDWMETA